MNCEHVYIGIDPGKEGFITTIRGSEINHWAIPKTGKDVDLYALSSIVLSLAELHGVQNCTAIIEDVHALPGSAAGATFTFGGICWALRMAFIMCGVKVVLVSPKRWQKEMYVGIKPDKDKKVMSVQAAQLLFPGHNLYRTDKCRKPDNNLTDSLLIAEYGRRHNL